MSVKRYDFDCYAFYDSARLNVQECDDGDYVLHSDYAELEARHNALVEAVRAARRLEKRLESECGDETEWKTAYCQLQHARDEVDRLIADGEG